MPRAEGVLFCGGGTGGHVLPGLAVASSLRDAGERHLRWIGDPDRLEAKLVPKAGIDLLPLGLRRPRPQDPRWILHALRTVSACLRELLRRPPRVVVALGGYAALVPGILAPILRRPLVVMEQNAHAGRTNRLLARGAVAVVTQFPEAAATLPAHRVHLLGNPVRAIAAQIRGTAPRLRVLVMGGSLAARSVNDLALATAPTLAGRGDVHVIHLAGADDAERCRQAWQSAGVRPVEAGDDAQAAAGATVEVHGFVEDMPALYRRVDLCVGRSGATTVAECCVGGIGALYIPLPWAAEDHQTANAQAVVRVGGAEILPQHEADGPRLAIRIAHYAGDRRAVAALGQGARSLARPRAAAQVAALVRASGLGQGTRRVDARRRHRHRLSREPA